MAMRIYAGIDEAGYGPTFGPLVVGRAVMAVDDSLIEKGGRVKDLWSILDSAVCKRLAGSKGRIAVNDSKKIYTRSAGLKHLERGVLTFAGLCNQPVSSVDQWLAAIGDTRYKNLANLPWYTACDQHPWQQLPTTCDPNEMAIARNILKLAMQKANAKMLDMQAAVIFEDQFNKMVAATRSKAAMSFTFVNAHLRNLWDNFARQGVIAAVDRQSGRSHYRELLAPAFPEAQIKVLQEDNQCSQYRLSAGKQTMIVSFEVSAEQCHMPVALASMVSKYTREILMARFNYWFTTRIPNLKPTAGYALDGKRFWKDIQPHLVKLNIDGSTLRRIS